MIAGTRKRKSVRGRLFRLVTVLSLILLVATIVLWVRSYRYFDLISWGHFPNPECYLISSHGHVAVSVATPLRQNARRVYHSLPGVYWMSGNQKSAGGPRYFQGCTVRHCWPTVIFAIPPFLALAAKLRRKKRTEECETCGYNLTGNVSGVCPECGSKIYELRTLQESGSGSV